MQLVWFRRDLRVEDNTALTAAVETGDPVVALFVATPGSWHSHHLAPIQADLIYARLHQLQSDLAELNIQLLYLQVDSYSDSVNAVCELAAKIGAHHVRVNKEYEWNEVQRDRLVKRVLSRVNVRFSCYDDKCLFAPGAILNKQGLYFKVFTPFKQACLSKLTGNAPKVVKPKQAAPVDFSRFESLKFFYQRSPFDYPREPSDLYRVKTREIRQLLREFCHDSVDNYHLKRDFPAEQGTSRLSPYLAIGALSVRQCLARLQYDQPFPLSAGREAWRSELVWRDFYQHLIYFEPKLSKGRNFLSWADHLQWQKNESRLTAWQTGKTGYPIVDAAMRQLNQTGWMHNRLRMIAASFLTKHLHIHWRSGERYFMGRLIDGDYASNNGGWQWSASTGCDAQPYFRMFNPMAQGEKYDANGEFIRYWIPELRNVPDRFIHQPWRWSDFNRLTYPPPIVDHKTERALTLELFKQAKASG